MIDIYKAYLADLESIGVRYASANAYYMTVVSALLGVLVFAEGKKALSDMRLEIVLSVCVFSMLICWIWRKSIHFYRALFDVKFMVLRNLELQLPFQAFTDEGRILADRKIESLLQNERWVPTLLMGFFGLLAATALIRLVFLR